MDKLVVGHPPPQIPIRRWAYTTIILSHDFVMYLQKKALLDIQIFFFILSKLNQIYWEKIKEIEKQNTPQ